MRFILKASFVLLGFALIFSCKSKQVDYSESTIILERTGCYGTCPIFTFTLKGNGTAELKNDLHVEPIGHFVSMCEMDSVQSLFREFQKTNWDTLSNKYPHSSTDLPSVILTWKHRDLEKRIVIVGNHPEILDVLIKKTEKAKDRFSWKKL